MLVVKEQFDILGDMLIHFLAVDTALHLICLIRTKETKG